MDLKRIKSDLADRCISEDDTRELIAEVEFLTKVAEQAINDVHFKLYGVPHKASTELAQYLKRGKE